MLRMPRRLAIALVIALAIVASVASSRVHPVP